MLGILYSGQGAQVEKMGFDIYNEFKTAKEFYDRFNDIRDITFNLNLEELSKTINTQPTLVAFHIVITKILKELNIKFDITAGLSLGEFSSLYAAEVLNETDILNIIKTRAKAMSEACKENPSNLIAILNKDENKIFETIENLRLKNLRVEIANMNCPGQIVIGILAEDKEEVLNYLKENNLKTVILNVEGAFHTFVMDKASLVLKNELQKYKFNDEKIPIIFNTTANTRNNENFITLLSNQANHTTYFHKSIVKMIDMGVDTFLEIGNNNIFKGFIRKINKNINVIPINSVETIKSLKTLI